VSFQPPTTQHRTLPGLLAILACLTLLTACPDKTRSDTAQTAETPHTTPSDAVPPSGHNQSRLYGVVKETFDSGGYTYVLLDSGKQTFWAAGPKTPLSAGAMAGISTRMPMRHYHSKTLNRDFDLIYFTDHISTDTPGHEKPPAIDELDPHAGIARAPAAQPVAGIEKADNGKTIDEIFKQQKQLAGKTVRVRGKVVKFTRQVLGRNWIHIRDGSTGRDLTLTTHDSAALDDIIVAEGVLGLGKDFGYGYVYDVILEESRLGQ